jgi:uncharacterized Rossmann fold enzyme
MFYKNWEPIYRKILKDFNFEEKDDIQGAAVLNKLLDKKDLFYIEELEKLIDNNEVIVFGAGPCLEKSIKKHKQIIEKQIKIAADGTTTALMKNHILPDIIVSDLDGKISDQITACSKGSIIIVHAHGGNIDKIKKYVPKFKNKIIGSTQTNPESYENLHNFGGFTDGDRAVFFAEHFNAKKLDLIGFDYDGKIGEYSFANYKDKNIKMKKLKWCKKLIKLLQRENNNITYL